MWLIREEEETNPDYGKEPEKRNIEELINSSVIVVDKHSGPTSHQISQWIKEIFNVKKVGHAGTLDPKVTGVLIVALGEAVKAMPVLMGLDKEYVGVMHLHKDVSEDLLKENIKNFIGRIKQIPPKKSAVARKIREREVRFFDILEVNGRDVLFRVGTEAGTYIRKLVHDFGLSLNVGAHMTELRRIIVGNFHEDQAHSLVEIKDAYEFWRENKEEKELRKILIPIEFAIDHVKKVFVKDSAVDSICNGAPVYVNGITRIQKNILAGETIAIMSLKNELIALGIAKMKSEEMYEKKVGLAVRTDRVFMKKGTYPSVKK
ncbi:MAG: RNA-guided pseudouridylation complex pseudouridine synthase subunit Cbf5 [Candidatus Aenigmatarchaeota archaeon]